MKEHKLNLPKSYVSECEVLTRNGRISCNRHNLGDVCEAWRGSFATGIHQYATFPNHPVLSILFSPDCPGLVLALACIYDPRGAMLEKRLTSILQGSGSRKCAPVSLGMVLARNSIMIICGGLAKEANMRTVTRG